MPTSVSLLLVRDPPYAARPADLVLLLEAPLNDVEAGGVCGQRLQIGVLAVSGLGDPPDPSSEISDTVKLLAWAQQTASEFFKI
jgi:hypothetical protein